MYGIYPEITKKYILLNINQEDIMEKYVKIPVSNESLKPNSFCNPFRIDNNPSCNYWYSSNGKLRFRDWSKEKNYDCFDVVACDNNLNVKNKRDFIKILHIIAKDFRINRYENKEFVKEFENNFVKKPVKVKRRAKKHIIYKVKLRNPNYHDKSYFNKMELELEDLKGIYFIQEIYQNVNNYFKCIYRYNSKDVCYGYYGLKDKLYNYDLWKFYFPNRKKKGDIRGSKFITNGVFVQGIQYLIPDKICIITKSFKDVKIFNKLGIQSCAVAAESIIPSKKDMRFLKDNFDYLVSCMDFDLTGVALANKLKKRYSVEPFFFTNGKFKTINYNAKDASEFTTINNISELKTIIFNIYSNYKDLIIEQERLMYNNLKFTRW